MTVTLDTYSLKMALFIDYQKPMTYLEAAHKILAQAGEPLHYATITHRALAQGLIIPTGRTPEATMGSRLYTDTLDEASNFARIGRGIFELVQWQPSGIDQQVQQINQSARTQLRDLLQSMPPERFEALITELLIQMGFDENTVSVTPYGNALEIPSTLLNDC